VKQVGSLTDLPQNRSILSSISTKNILLLSYILMPMKLLLDNPFDMLLCQFKVKKSKVHYILTHLDPTKSIGDDNIRVFLKEFYYSKYLPEQFGFVRQ